MPRVLLPAALMLTAVLSACGGGDLTPTAATLELTGGTSLAVGASAQLSAVLRDVNGQALPTQVTYTSSQPGVIGVDAPGNLTVKRLTATDSPVKITASAGGKTATLVVSTYGLELAVGTYVWNLQPFGAAPGRFIAVRYRPESGETQASTFTVTAPGNESLSCELSPKNINNWCWWALPDATKYPAGEYRAGLIQNGLVYATTATLPKPGATLGFVDGGAATINQRAVTFGGKLPADAKWLYSYVANSRVETSSLTSRQTAVLRGQAEQPGDPLAVSVYSTALPTTLNVGSAVTAGSYDTWITAMSGDLSSFADVLPEQFNVSATFSGKVTLK
ncbi:hypothetical protein [Deinococcus sp. AJ005]|uniref:hypothetical protein n=1 Tax=Deinococcus sp. AJ005 TaxID=2652443 RepID=UPI00125CAD76|nr:hypothetical protein [Deinococcus sp. AJ005]QFP77576.1 hypothetical protein DAAJ005_14765 [Deinococcus sp. AJ005]